MEKELIKSFYHKHKNLLFPFPNIFELSLNEKGIVYCNFSSNKYEFSKENIWIFLEPHVGKEPFEVRGEDIIKITLMRMDRNGVSQIIDSIPF